MFFYRFVFDCATTFDVLISEKQDNLRKYNFNTGYYIIICCENVRCTVYTICHKLWVITNELIDFCEKKNKENLFR